MDARKNFFNKRHHGVFPGSDSMVPQRISWVSGRILLVPGTWERFLGAGKFFLSAKKHSWLISSIFLFRGCVSCGPRSASQVPESIQLLPGSFVLAPGSKLSVPGDILWVQGSVILVVTLVWHQHRTFSQTFKVCNKVSFLLGKDNLQFILSPILDTRISVRTLFVTLRGHPRVSEMGWTEEL